MYVLELGGQDDAFAAREAASAATGVTLVGAGVATATALSDRVSDLAFTHRASTLLGRTDPDPASARALLDAAGIDRTGSVAVRAVDVRATTGVDTQYVERELGSVLVDRGFEVDLEDPDHELRALFAGAPGAENTVYDHGREALPGSPVGGSDAVAVDAPDDGACLLGWLAVESDRGFGERAPTDRPFFQPGSMDPMLARALANIAGARDGKTVVDPMCGTGGILLEAALVGARVVGNDAQAKMARGTRANLVDALGADAPFDVVRGDARRLPLAGDAADAAVFDAPYGRQSKIAADSLAALVGDALAEVRRVAPRAVVVGDRQWADAAADAGWRVESTFRRRVHRSLDRHVTVIERE